MNGDHGAADASGGVATTGRVLSVAESGPVGMKNLYFALATAPVSSIH